MHKHEPECLLKIAEVALNEAARHTQNIANAVVFEEVGEEGTNGRASRQVLDIVKISSIAENAMACSARPRSRWPSIDDRPQRREGDVDWDVARALVEHIADVVDLANVAQDVKIPELDADACAQGLDPVARPPEVLHRNALHHLSGLRALTSGEIAMPTFEASFLRNTMDRMCQSLKFPSLRSASSESRALRITQTQIINASSCVACRVTIARPCTASDGGITEKPSKSMFNTSPAGQLLNGAAMVMCTALRSAINRTLSGGYNCRWSCKTLNA